MHEYILKLQSKLFQESDIAILVFFRVIFGGIMLYQVIKYFDKGWISAYWVEPPINFKYYGFEWVTTISPEVTYFLFTMLGVLAIFIIFGFKYKIATALFFIIFSYFFLLEMTRYLNHFYLILLINFLLIFVPANRALSLDVWFNKNKKLDVVPFWTIWILKFQISIAYIYGGIAKLNPDWLRGEPLREWLADRTDFPVIGEYFLDEGVVYFLTYSALLIDLLIVPFLLWKKTRIAAYVILVMFNLFNSQLFNIGIFPWFMILAALVFFDPSWPRFKKWKKTVMPKKKLELSNLTKNQKIILTMIFIFVLVQTTVPLRHHLYPGEVLWTEEGHYFAWMMKLRDKDTYTFEVTAIDHTNNKKGIVNPLYDIRDFQLSKVTNRPDLLVQYAHYLKENLRDEGYSEDVEIRIETWVSLNSREPQLLVDPNMDLSIQNRTMFHKTWVLPLED